MPVQVFQHEAVIAAPEVTPLPFNVEGSCDAPYPLPRLQVSDVASARTVNLVTLRNAHGETTLCPDLGGRLVASAALGIHLPSEMSLTSGGSQGLEWQHGIVWRPVGRERADIGPVHAELRLPHEDDESGGFVMSGLTEDGAYLWRVALAIASKDEAPCVEGQVYQLDYRPTRFASGWCAFGGDDWLSTQIGYPGRRCQWVQGLGASPSVDPFELSWPDFSFGSSERVLAKASELMGLGQPSLPTTPPLLEAWAGRIAAENAMIEGDWLRVADLADSALEFNARDHRLWWLRSVAARKMGEDDGGALANAIYLWGEDPLLKAESVVRAPYSETGEAHPIVKTLQGDPAAMVEAAVQFCRLRLDDELSRWVHECLKIREVPLLRYLLAYALLTRSRFDAQAAEHVVLAGRQPLAPPFAARPFEKLVLSTLAKRFASDKRLELLLKLMDWGPSA